MEALADDVAASVHFMTQQNSFSPIVYQPQLTSTFGVYFELKADITTPMTRPIGTYQGNNNRGFCGHFNGNHHTITLDITESMMSALFIFTHSATISNLRVNGSVTETATMGAAGGIVGLTFQTTISQCINYANVTGSE